jgi:hypothetical protein
VLRKAIRLFAVATFAFSILSLMSGCEEKGHTAYYLDPPVIQSLNSDRPVICLSETTAIRCEIPDQSGMPLHYVWTAAAGSFTGDSQDTSVVTWRAPAFNAQTPDSTAYWIAVRVSNIDASTDDTIRVSVVMNDLYFDTGEPFWDLPDSNGVYNGICDENERWIDLPSSYYSPYMPRTVCSTNGLHDGPNGYMDEYELFCNFGDDSAHLHCPVAYSWQDFCLSFNPPIHYEWVHLPALSTGQIGCWAYMEGYSTWRDRDNDGVFDIRPY